MTPGRFASTLAALLAAAAATTLGGEDPRPPERITLRVRVTTDEDLGPPVEGARVAVHDWKGDIAIGRTDDHGVAVLDLGAPSERLARSSSGGSLVVEASGGGRGHRVHRVEFRERTDGAMVWVGKSDADLALPAGAPLGGRVLDAATGAPVAGARVAADAIRGGVGGQGFEPPHPAEVTTGADGAFRFDGLAVGEVCGDARVTVVAAGRAPVQRDVAVQSGRMNDANVFRLEPAGTIRGRVTEADGNPVGHRWLELESQEVFSPDGDDPSRFVLTRTDDAGAFSFPGAAFGVRHVVRAMTADGWVELEQPGAMRGIVVTRERPVADLALRLLPEDRARRASLFVGVSAASAMAKVGDVSGRLEVPGEDWMVASASGNPLVFHDVAPGRYRLSVGTAELPDWTGDVEVAAGTSPTRTRVEVGGKALIAGRVVGDRGLVHVTWRTPGEEPHFVLPDGNGEFRIPGLAAGRYRLSLMAFGHPIAGVDETDVTAPASDVRLVVPPTGSVALRLVAPEGGALPRWVWTEEGSARCTGDRVVVNDVRAGRRQVRIEARDPVEGEYLPLAFDVEVKPGETTDAGDVRLDRGKSVSGVVLGPDGVATSDATLVAGRASTRPDVDGTFTLRPLPPGEAEILAYSQRCAAYVRVDPAKPPAKLELRLAAARRVLIDTAAASAPGREWFRVEAVPRGATRPFPQAWQWSVNWGQADARGVTRFDLLPGEWTLKAISADESVRATQDVSVAAGDGPLRITMPVR